LSNLTLDIFYGFVDCKLEYLTIPYLYYRESVR
jgi:hypothetical protein